MVSRKSVGEIVMIKIIIKRDGSSQKFVPFKIEDAIKKAFESEVKAYDKRVFAELMDTVKNRDEISVEEIQDIIEKVLYTHQHFEVMKSFMLYRHMHKIQRELILGLDEDTTYINSTQTIKEYIDKEDWRINANSNTGYSNAGLVNNTAGKVIANFWLDTIYSKEEGYSHRDGDYHIHDLDCSNPSIS